MKVAIDIISTVLAVILLVWFLASWMNVISHNDPDDTGAPADWNAFVVLTEAFE